MGRGDHLARRSAQARARTRSRSSAASAGSVSCSAAPSRASPTASECSRSTRAIPTRSPGSSATTTAERPRRRRDGAEGGAGQLPRSRRTPPAVCSPSSSWASSTPASSGRSTRPPTPSPRSSRRSTRRPPTGSSPADQRRILGGDEAAAYQEFGLVFLQAKRYDLAIKAFERGLDYDPDDPQLPLLLGADAAEGRQGRGGPGARRAVPQAAAARHRGLRAARQDPDRAEARERDHTRARGGGQGRLEEHRRSSTPWPIATARSARSTRPRRCTSRCSPRSRRPRATARSPRRSSSGRRPRSCSRSSTEADEPAGRARRGRRTSSRRSIDDPAYADQVLDAGLKLLSADPPALDRGRPSRPDQHRHPRREAREAPAAPAARAEAEPDPAALQGDRRARCSTSRSSTRPPRPSRRCSRSIPTSGTPGNSSSSAEIHRAADKPDQAIERRPRGPEARPERRRRPAPARRRPEPDRQGSTRRSRSLARRRQERPGQPRLQPHPRQHPDPVRQERGGDRALQGAARDAPEQRGGRSGSPARASRSSTSTWATTPRARPSSRSCSQRNPDDAGVNNDLGYLYADQGKNLEKAEAMIRKAVQEEPDNGAYLDSLGWVLFKRGKVKEAVEPAGEGRQEAARRRRRRDDLRAPGRRLLPAPGDRQGEGGLGDGREGRRQGRSRPTSGCPRSARSSNRSRSSGRLPSRRRATRPDSGRPRRPPPRSRACRPAAVRRSPAVIDHRASTPFPIDPPRSAGVEGPMAGHSHSANIAHRKGAVDAKRGKLFSKLCRAIYVAAKNGGGDPDIEPEAPLRDRQGPLRTAAPRTTSSARSRRGPASSAPRTSRRSSTKATAPAAWPSSARS